MRGTDLSQESLFVMKSLDQFVPGDHPLRPIRAMVNEALVAMHKIFEAMYADGGRESIPPEWLLRSLLLQVLYSIRSERQLVDQLHYNMLFRWFVGLSMEEAVWDHSTFSKNRDRIIEGSAIEEFFEQIVERARHAGLLSGEHFSVDGTLVRAWASQASFRRRDGGDDAGSGKDFHGEKRSNDTHASTTDPESRLYRKSKGQEAHLVYLGHVMTDNRHGLSVAGELTAANGTAERDAALALLDELPGERRKTLGADKAYDTADFVKGCRDRNVTPHVAQNDTNRKSAIDQRTTRHEGYGISQNARRKQEGVFGWAKRIGGLSRTMLRGTPKVRSRFLLTLAGLNLVRLRNLGVGAVT